MRPNQPPDGAVYVGRVTRNGWHASKWANPFREGRDGTRDEVIAKHRAWICDSPDGRALLADIHELRGHDLLCWCAPMACHADTLRELANEAA